MSTRTEHKETKDHKIMNTEIQTVGKAIILQQVIRWLAIAGIFWLCLTFADTWVRLALS